MYLQTALYNIRCHSLLVQTMCYTTERISNEEGLNGVKGNRTRRRGTACNIWREKKNLTTVSRGSDDVIVSEIVSRGQRM